MRSNIAEFFQLIRNRNHSPANTEVVFIVLVRGEHGHNSYVFFGERGFQFVAKSVIATFSLDKRALPIIANMNYNDFAPPNSLFDIVGPVTSCEQRTRITKDSADAEFRG